MNSDLEYIFNSWQYNTFQEIVMTSPEMKKLIDGEANKIARRAGKGYRVSGHVRGCKYLAFVSTGTREAAKDNMQNNTLLRAVSG